MSNLSSSKYNNFRFLKSRFSKHDGFQSCVFLNLQHSKVSRDATLLKLPLAATVQRWSTTPTSLVGGSSHVNVR